MFLILLSYLIMIINLGLSFLIIKEGYVNFHKYEKKLNAFPIIAACLYFIFEIDWALTDQISEIGTFRDTVWAVIETLLLLSIHIHMKQTDKYLILLEECEDENFKRKHKDEFF